MSSAEDQRYLDLALELAQRPEERVSPNPRVGAVVVKDGRVVGQGFHRGPGTPHAEVAALAEAGSLSRGSTLYVTLEPCCHFGRTPPCTGAIIRAGVKRVVAPLEDPNPHVHGQGFAELRQAGIEVSVGTEAEAALRLNLPYFTWRRLGRPFVTAKWAMALSGHAAARTGESLYLTGPEALREAHRLRAQHDAVLVGVNTVLQDDPQLTVRLIEGSAPLRVVLDAQLRTPPEARLLEAPGSTLLLASAGAADERVAALSGRAEVVRVGKEPFLPLEAVLQELAQRGVTSLLVEGGPTVLGHFFDAQLVDRIAVFVAPLVLGGSTAPAAVGGLGAASPAMGLRLNRGHWSTLGADACFTADVERG